MISNSDYDGIFSGSFRVRSKLYCTVQCLKRNVTALYDEETSSCSCSSSELEDSENGRNISQTGHDKKGILI